MVDKAPDYRLYLSSRISVLEKVVEKLAAEHVASADYPAKALSELRKAVMADFDIALGNTGGAHLEPQHQEWLRQENASSKAKAETLFLRLERHTRSDNDI